MSAAIRERRRALGALAFILPNIIGFLAFTLVPMLASLVMAFTNWDIKLHNIYTGVWPSFNGLANWTRLFHEFDFWKYFGNTLYLMIGIPFGIVLSLIAAIMLTRNLDGGSPAAKRTLVTWAVLAGLGLVLGAALMAAGGAPLAGLTVLLGGLACALLLGGTLLGSDLYRTLFYIPNFTAGVATYILWQKLYSPHTGPINLFLEPWLLRAQGFIRPLPEELFKGAALTCLAGLLLMVAWILRFLANGWRDGEVGGLSLAWACLLVLVPAFSAPFLIAAGAGWALALTALGVAGLVLFFGMGPGRDFPCPSPSYGIGASLMAALGVLTLEFAALGLSALLDRLPSMAAAGLAPPDWLSSYDWAKPAMIIMGLWAAVGSQNMLLYIAGLTSIPPELNEAAQIDGASGWQHFWYITWPQLAPVTFFIFIMSMIGGLQGGFEMAETMTAGGPAGSTTTLAYFVYTEGFETGRLGYASAISWMIFFMVFIVTLFNWKFGDRYVDS